MQSFLVRFLVFCLVDADIEVFQPSNDKYSRHTETSLLICRANQVTGFYMMRKLVVKRLTIVHEAHGCLGKI